MTIQEFAKLFIKCRDFYHCAFNKIPHPWTHEQSQQAWHDLCVAADTVIFPTDQGINAHALGLPKNANPMGIPSKIAEWNIGWEFFVEPPPHSPSSDSSTACKD